MIFDWDLADGIPVRRAAARRGRSGGRFATACRERNHQDRRSYYRDGAKTSHLNSLIEPCADFSFLNDAPSKNARSSPFELALKAA